ncbi:MAG: hypothetical protein CM15mP120_17030 [Pseudomonadota bacterium]|nr:MAG: hypothetical protein CM15mP120_17030 [Pseudomonadota bacterium]
MVRGEHIMTEYWNRPEATAETIVDGWLHTGDVATMDEQGLCLFRTHQRHDHFWRRERLSGRNRRCTGAHPGISEAAVIGQQSERWGESPLAIVVKTDDALQKMTCWNTAMAN